MKIPLPRHRAIYLHGYYKRLQWVIGFSSKTKDDNHIPIFDFDDVKYSKVKDFCKEIIYVFGASDIYLFETDVDNKYHLICLRKYPFYDYAMMLALSYAKYDLDYWFMRKSLERKKGILRFSTKLKPNRHSGKKIPIKTIPIHKETIEGLKIPQAELSNSHKRFLEVYYGLKDLNIPHYFLDGFDLGGLEIEVYETGLKT